MLSARYKFTGFSTEINKGELMGVLNTDAPGDVYNGFSLLPAHQSTIDIEIHHTPFLML
jgi:hypothetical protein